MPPPSKNARIPLGEPLATEFAALRATIGGGATEIGVIRDACRDYIKQRLRDRKFRERYEEELGKLRATKPAVPLRLVTDETS
jgi:hypothetical protein